MITYNLAKNFINSFSNTSSTLKLIKIGSLSLPSYLVANLLSSSVLKQLLFIIYRSFNFRQ